jgi:hypothetical protein
MFENPDMGAPSFGSLTRLPGQLGQPPGTIIDWSANAEAKIGNQNLIAQVALQIWTRNVHVIPLFARPDCMNA